MAREGEEVSTLEPAKSIDEAEEADEEVEESSSVSLLLFSSSSLSLGITIKSILEYKKDYSLLV